MLARALAAGVILREFVDTAAVVVGKVPETGAKARLDTARIY